jgi:hypothetical protein
MPIKQVVAAVRAFRVNADLRPLTGARTESASIFRLTQMLLATAQRRKLSSAAKRFLRELCEEEADYYFGPGGRWPDPQSYRLVLGEMLGALK